MWGRLVTCRRLANRPTQVSDNSSRSRSKPINNRQQVTNLPHKNNPCVRLNKSSQRAKKQRFSTTGILACVGVLISSQLHGFTAISNDSETVVWSALSTV